jgi:hypothetical protein
MGAGSHRSRRREARLALPTSTRALLFGAGRNPHLVWKEGASRKKAGIRLDGLRNASAGWDFFAGDFKFADDPERSALAWFDGRGEAAARFRVFGQEGSGGLYGVHHSESNREPAPTGRA